MWANSGQYPIDDNKTGHINMTGFDTWAAKDPNSSPDKFDFGWFVRSTAKDAKPTDGQFIDASGGASWNHAGDFSDSDNLNFNVIINSYTEWDKGWPHGDKSLKIYDRQVFCVACNPWTYGELRKGPQPTPTTDPVK